MSERRSRLRRKRQAETAAHARHLLPTSTRDALAKATKDRDLAIASANRAHMEAVSAAKAALYEKPRRAWKEFDARRGLILAKTAETERTAG